LIPSGNKITILLVDNQPTTVAGLRTLFSKTKDIEIIGNVPSGYDVYSVIPNLEPTLLLLDIVTREPNPIELIKWIHENHKKTCVLIFTSIEDIEKISQMMNAGACGYISKTENEEAIVDAIRKVANGEIIFSPEQYQKAKEWKEKVGNILDELTRQEVEVLKLLAKGLGNQEISDTLNISIKTTAFHVTNILSKLRVKSRQEAAIWAVRNLSDNLE
jgi:two-component system, NarL family, response regulator LiaR